MRRPGTRRSRQGPRPWDPASSRRRSAGQRPSLHDRIEEAALRVELVLLDRLVRRGRGVAAHRQVEAMLGGVRRAARHRDRHVRREEAVVECLCPQPGQPESLRLAADRAPGEVLLHRARRRVVRRSVAEVAGPVDGGVVGGRGGDPLVHHRRDPCRRRAAQVGPDQAHPERELQHGVRHERLEDEVGSVPGLEGAERDPVRVDRRVAAPHLAEVRVQAALRISGRGRSAHGRCGSPGRPAQRPGGHVEEVADLGRPRDRGLPAGVSVTAGRVDQHHVAVVGKAACVRRVVGVVLRRAAAMEHLEQREAGGGRRGVGDVNVGVEADGRPERVRRRHRNAVGADANAAFA